MPLQSDLMTAGQVLGELRSLYGKVPEEQQTKRGAPARNSDSANQISAEIKNFREALGYTKPHQFANALGISRPSAYRWEGGEPPPPSQIDQFARLFSQLESEERRIVVLHSVGEILAREEKARRVILAKAGAGAEFLSAYDNTTFNRMSEMLEKQREAKRTEPFFVFLFTDKSPAQRSFQSFQSSLKDKYKDTYVAVEKLAAGITSRPRELNRIGLAASPLNLGLIIVEYDVVRASMRNEVFLEIPVARPQTANGNSAGTTAWIQLADKAAADCVLAVNEFIASEEAKREKK